MERVARVTARFFYNPICYAMAKIMHPTCLNIIPPNHFSKTTTVESTPYGGYTPDGNQNIVVYMQELTKYRNLFQKDFPFESLLALYVKHPASLHSKTSEIVYRIAINGAVDQAFFLPSILEDKNKARYAATHITAVSLADWSVSCYTIRKDANKTLCMLKKHNPPAMLAVGTIREGTGLWAYTNEWSDKSGDSHVDWWIFAGMSPLTDFEVQ